jgi:hypothetical protein
MFKRFRIDGSPAEARRADDGALHILDDRSVDPHRSKAWDGGRGEDDLRCAGGFWIALSAGDRQRVTRT